VFRGSAQLKALYLRISVYRLYRGRFILVYRGLNDHWSSCNLLMIVRVSALRGRSIDDT